MSEVSEGKVTVINCEHCHQDHKVEGNIDNRLSIQPLTEPVYTYVYEKPPDGRCDFELPEEVKNEFFIECPFRRKKTYLCGVVTQLRSIWRWRDDFR